MTVEKKITTIEEVPVRMRDFWSLLTESEQMDLLPYLTLRRFRKHELIYREGESPEHLLCLLDGKVKIFRDGVGGRSQIMRILRPQQYFGYRASLAAEPYVTAAAAFEPSLVCEIPMIEVRRIMETNNKVCLFFIRELAVDLGLSDKRTVSLTQKHIRGRLAESLIFLKETYGTERDGRTLDICFSREDLAHLSNMTTSNAIRTLSQFAAEGIIETVGKKVRIVDEDALRKVSRIG